MITLGEFAVLYLSTDSVTTVHEWNANIMEWKEIYKGNLDEAPMRLSELEVKSFEHAPEGLNIYVKD